MLASLEQKGFALELISLSHEGIMISHFIK